MMPKRAKISGMWTAIFIACIALYLIFTNAARGRRNEEVNCNVFDTVYSLTVRAAPLRILRRRCAGVFGIAYAVNVVMRRRGRVGRRVYSDNDL